ncbi:hypothetical protein QBC37DRAFT_86190 [Rhypophila decipiens]|uniref:Uncharacterized protein n=1 Tax=Rhypophila decipiens TaxID=261697 RepID=A0AAN6XVT2_9PEZI|nr:hypothetical protein QBC37DRAFT_86190 [Rhypophila decipiens]
MSGNGSTRQCYSHICSRYYACTTEIHYRTNMASLVVRRYSAYLPGIWFWFSQTIKVGARRNDSTVRLTGPRKSANHMFPQQQTRSPNFCSLLYKSAVSDIIMLQSYRWITTPSRGRQIEPTYAVWSTWPIRSREKSKQKKTGSHIQLSLLHRLFTTVQVNRDRRGRTGRETCSSRRGAVGRSVGSELGISHPKKEIRSTRRNAEDRNGSLKCVPQINTPWGEERSNLPWS